MVPFAGWEMPVQYASIIDEHKAVRSAAGIFDVSHMGEIDIRGSDAEAYCRRILSNDVAALDVGKAQYTLLLNETAGVIDDLLVYKFADDRFFACVNASNVEKDFSWMRSQVFGDLEVVNVSEAYGLIAVQGPDAVELVRRQVEGLDGVGRFGFAQARFEGEEFMASRTGYTGEDGFELFVCPSIAPTLWKALAAAGPGGAPAPVGLGARDTLRLEAALPLHGHELSESINPYEAGLGWTVKLNRPDMIAAAELEKIKKNGPERRLIGLSLDRGIAREGSPVLAGESEIGIVTSGSHCPSLGRAVCMALVKSGEALQNLSVEVRGKPRAASLAELPFYKRR